MANHKRKDASRERYEQLQRERDAETIALGGVPGRKFIYYKKRWGWGEGDILHFMQETRHPVYQYPIYSRVCDYDGYIGTDTEFFNGDIQPPEYYTCENCRRMVILMELGE